MIGLVKLDESDPEYGSAIAWLAKRRAQYREARKAGSSVTRYLTSYSRDDVKAAIIAETNEKCAYCESKYAGVAWGDVDHILPKSRDPERLLDYSNLSLVCSRCNNAKHDKEYDKDGLLNPYIDDPGKFIRADGPMIVADPSNARYVRGDRTITEIDLNRAGLFQSRAAAIREKWHVIVREYVNAPNQALKDYAGEQIDRLISPKAEFSMAARAFFEQHLPEHSQQ